MNKNAPCLHCEHTFEKHMVWATDVESDYNYQRCNECVGKWPKNSFAAYHEFVLDNIKYLEMRYEK